MKTLLALLFTVTAASAQPIITNQDDVEYSLHIDCSHISAGSQIHAGETHVVEQYKPASKCFAEIYPSENPFGKDGDYDPKKRYARVKLKSSSECVIVKRRMKCE